MFIINNIKIPSVDKITVPALTSMASNVTFAPTTVCGLSIKAAKGIVKTDNWLLTPYTNEASQRYVVWTIGEDGNVIVKKFNHGKQPEDAILVEKVTEEELAELLEADVWSQKQLAALCFSVVCNKGPIETFSTIIQEYGLAKKNKRSNTIKRAFVAHMVWLVNNSWNVDGIMADEVFKLISYMMGWSEDEQRAFLAGMSLKSFYGPNNIPAKNYRATYNQFWTIGAVPPQFDVVRLKQNFADDVQRCDAIEAMLA
jgi:hypothetical protein